MGMAGPGQPHGGGAHSQQEMGLGFAWVRQGQGSRMECIPRQEISRAVLAFVLPHEQDLLRGAFAGRKVTYIFTAHAGAGFCCGVQVD